MKWPSLRIKMHLVPLAFDIKHTGDVQPAQSAGYRHRQIPALTALDFFHRFLQLLGK